MQLLTKAVFDFSMGDKKKRITFAGNLKLAWQFSYLTFSDQDLMMLELKYKQLV